MRQRTVHPTSFLTGKRLKELRESMNFSIREVSNLSGVDFTMIKKIENGKTDPSIVQISHIINGLKLDLRDFFDERYAILFEGCLNGQEDECEL